jgi:5-formyltetrahydrofolate cyclo-ligase
MSENLVMRPSGDDRSGMRHRRRHLTVNDRHADAGACQRVVELLAALAAESVGLYFAHDGELDPTTIGSACRAAGCTTWYPVVEGGALLFQRWDGHSPLVPGRFGIPTPPGDEVAAVESLDAIVVPLVAFDSHCNRAGYGQGYYDRTLGAVTRRPHLIGLGYDFQELDPWTPAAWDVAMDVVATPTRTLVREV